MPEKPRGRDPNRQQEKQEQLPEYHKAARFPDELTSNSAYEQTRDIIYEAPFALSLYLTVLLPNLTPPPPAMAFFLKYRTYVTPSRKSYYNPNLIYLLANGKYIAMDESIDLGCSALGS